MPIKVAITDDHLIAINGIRTMLADFPEVEVTAFYTTGAALLEGLQKEQPDVLLLDILLPDQSGHELAPIVGRLYPDVRIVVITSLDAPAIVKSMLHHGCKGYLLKGADQATLFKAVQAAYNNEQFIEPSLKDMLLQNMLGNQKRASNVPLELTRREKEVLQLIVAGDTTQEIADKLFISPRTAETHRLTLLKKLDVKNTAGLVRMAITLGLVDG